VEQLSAMKNSWECPRRLERIPGLQGGHECMVKYLINWKKILYAREMGHDVPVF
jgi:hypothetical protein